MCGICGFTAATGSSDDAAALRAMCDAMAHRGPDGEGRYIADGIALGHRRLSLIDLEGGGQPMIRATGEEASPVWSPAVKFDHERGLQAAPGAEAGKECMRGRWSIVFNGELYNYRELRDELRELGYSFTTDSDTEVLLVGYIAWSHGVLHRLRGMFAFAIYDARKGELFCARDFFGIKPFYYTVQPTRRSAPGQAGAGGQKRFIFASEIKSILEHPDYERELNGQALMHYLCFQFSALDETFFKGVYKLPQGHFMRVDRQGTIEIERYWHPTYDFNEQRSMADAVKDVAAAVAESVRFHNVADVEVGSFLSSGIDSSYLAACLAHENPSIKTFTVGFAEYEGERDEVSWARELAESLGVQNDAKHIGEDEYWNALPLVQWHMDEPSADPSAVALYFVDALAARSVKAVLSGEGADELFGGYRIYQTPLANAKVDWMPKPLLHAASSLLHATGARGANYLERASERVEEWYYTNANGVAFTPEQRDRLLSPEMRASLDGDGAGAPAPWQLTAPAFAEVAGLDEPARMQYVDTQFWLVGDILLKTDKMSMAHSLESRVPFLDRGVFEVASTLTREQRVDGHQTKIALRQAAQGVIPREWAQKQKLGFPVPLAAWLREDRYYAQVKEALTGHVARRFFDVGELERLLDEHRRGTCDHSRRIWIVYSFLLWYQVYLVDRRKPTPTAASPDIGNGRLERSS